MRRHASFIGLLVLGIYASAPAQAQGTVLHAIVADANTRNFILDAEVTVDPAGLKETTAFLGDARFAGLKKGLYTVRARRIGYAADEAEVELSGTDSLEVTMLLIPITNQLPTVKVEESMTTAFLREFEERRKLGKGHFITDSVLRASFASPLRDIIASRLPGIKILDGVGGNYIINSTRGSNHIGGVGGGNRPSGGLCPVMVYWNGIRIGLDPSDIPQSSVGGIEFYNAGTVPVQYQWPGHDCGVLLMWERP